MSEASPENLETLPENLEVKPVRFSAEKVGVQAAELLMVAAEPRPAGDNIKKALTRAARRVSAFLDEKTPMTPRRAEDIWHREAAVRGEEIKAIELAAAQNKIAQEARRERSELEARIARLEALLFQDEEFYGAERNALRELGSRHDRVVD